MQFHCQAKSPENKLRSTIERKLQEAFPWESARFFPSCELPDRAANIVRSIDISNSHVDFNTDTHDAAVRRTIPYSQIIYAAIAEEIRQCGGEPWFFEPCIENNAAVMGSLRLLLLDLGFKELTGREVGLTVSEVWRHQGFDDTWYETPFNIPKGAMKDSLPPNAVMGIDHDLIKYQCPVTPGLYERLSEVLSFTLCPCCVFQTLNDYGTDRRFRPSVDETTAGRLAEAIEHLVREIIYEDLN